MKRPEKLFRPPIQPENISFDDQGLSKAVNRESLIISLDLVIKSLGGKNNSLVMGVNNLNQEIITPEIITYAGMPTPQLKIGDEIKAYFFKGILKDYKGFDNSPELANFDSERLETDITNFGGGIGPGNVIFSFPKYHLFLPRELEKEEKAFRIEPKTGGTYIDSNILKEYHLEKTTLNQ